MAYTREQLYAAIRKADQAGDAEAVRALGRQLRTMEAPEDLDTSGIDAKDARAALQRGEQAFERRTAGMTARQKRIAREHFDADPRIRALRDRGDDFSMRDLGDATVNVAARGLQGALSPFSFLEDTAKTVQQGVNWGLGRGGGAVMRGLGLDDAANWWERGAGLVHQDNADRPTVHSLIEGAVPRPTDTAGQVASVASEFIGGLAVPIPGVKATPAARAAPIAAAVPADDIVREGQRAGVRVMTSDVIPPKTFIGKAIQTVGERIPFAGTGGTRAAQQTQRVEAVRTLLRDVGGDDVVQLFDDTPAALDDVARSLTAQRSRELTRLTGLKKGVISRLSSAGEVPVANTLQAIDDQIAMLTRRGTRPALEVVEELKTLRTAMQGKTLDQLEAIRADELSNAFTGNTLADVRAVGEKAVRAIYNPLREDMGEFIATRGAKGDLTAWKSSNERLAAMAGELNAATFRNVLRNTELTPEVVGRLLFSKNRSDVARLYANLDAPGKARAQAAVIQRAFDKAISADQGLSVERFVNNLSQLGDSVGVVFQGEDLARVQGLAKVLDATRRASAAAAAPATGVQNTPVVGGYALGTLFGNAAIPVAGAGGMLARIYESAPVRNLLLKLGRAKPGTPQESRLTEQLTRMTIAAVNTQGQKLARAANDDIGVAAAASDREEQQPE